MPQELGLANLKAPSSRRRKSTTMPLVDGGIVARQGGRELAKEVLDSIERELFGKPQQRRPQKPRRHK